VADVRRFGDRNACLIEKNCRSRDDTPNASTPYYSVFTIGGSRAVYGGTRAGVVCPDVTRLSVSATAEGAVLRWNWPANCTAVRVARRVDTAPDGPNDPHATSVLYSRTSYRDAGERFVDKIQASRGKFYYIVYAQAPGAAPGTLFATGTDDGCKAAFQRAPWMTLRYRFAPPSWKDVRAGKGPADRVAIGETLS
jgi:hypothetical protein